MECDGICSINGTCKGEVRSVEVTGEGMGWWEDFLFEFYYCETAIKSDREDGFIVKVLE